MFKIFNKEEKHQTHGLHIIIVGCGKVGQTLVEKLSNEGHDITIVDKNGQIIKELTEQYDIMGIVGNGASYSVLMEAGVKNADLIIAVTESDELNLLCCTVGKRVSECSAIARVRTPDYNAEVNYLKDKLGLAMIINPELEAAIEASRILYLPNALEVNSFAHGQAEMVKFQIPEGNVMDNLSIAELGQKTKSSYLICGIERDDEFFIPDGNFVTKAGDSVSFVAARSSIRNFFKEIGFATNHVRNTLIIGGGKAAYYLGKILIDMGVEVRIIESNKERCEELSILLPKATIINGDGTDQELLAEEDLAHTDSFVPLTGIDEENILLTLHAKKHSKAKVITKINRINFKDVINDLHLGSVIYPRYITAQSILAYVRAKNNSIDNNSIETLCPMFDSRAEAIEFIVWEDTGLTNIAFKDLSIKKNVLVAFINRNGNIIIPGGNDMLLPGDTVMIVTSHTGFNRLRDILN
ncbi:MAG: Trk system potassium transporter TrkA [Lachnospiraceae bacterium]|nr:Trk system potassium transporter TrkA [Lachnospiraceae bacterium]